ncbi:hypothetical protein [Microbacterium rhizosphaerae]|uniref:Acetyl-CoA carboxylase n=1 Tax=Microbacterium rhizosphaerae TaxID=1678237 RepID=A0ABZ0SL67_9MICO|nr:hypothetical protein [Microbacterium rhizosphaerae]WPR88940.1 hypothetical protein SM116_14395 [Microbacterium rhizosphaerae]
MPELTPVFGLMPVLELVPPESSSDVEAPVESSPPVPDWVVVPA